ncbi:PspC domain-containing protein [Alteromonas lipolytica]|uniref:Phage shock protein PspC N-terminal domain-containing protein n=1 Tax=Alteromonas lipolytica TaxID=1856405 RepID=A0A1E8FBR1_9ALTE|nr:hypothetical protein BFC17_03620 [Alteromonas lipolytica]GGF60401.1 hypothetical protein GCM10011338_10780 [Alteromonas lipolytica]
MSGYRCLRKSHNNILAGVAAGMAEFVGWEPKRARIGWLMLTFISLGSAVILYTFLAILFPPPDHFDLNRFRQ